MLRFSPLPNQAHMIPWHEWGDAAFRAAHAEDKPVMLYLSAFWCRFCQRMDEQAFSETENIALLNAYFISLRVEYAQRPDVDARYNLNGWPTIAFMTPEGSCLRPSIICRRIEFKELLFDVYMGYQQRKDELRAAAQATEESTPEPARQLDEAELATHACGDHRERSWCWRTGLHGGYDRGQKFIHPTS